MPRGGDDEFGVHACSGIRIWHHMAGVPPSEGNKISVKPVKVRNRNVC